MHGHALLYSPDFHQHRRAKALECLTSGLWQYGRIDVRIYDPQFSPEQAENYIKSHHLVALTLDQYVYCPKQSSSCRKGRCKHS